VPRAIRVGKYVEGTLHLQLLEKKEVKVELEALGNENDEAGGAKVGEKSKKKPHVRPKKDGPNIYAVPKSVCERIRNKTYLQVREKMLFSDFSNFKIEVSAEDLIIRQFLDDVERRWNADVLSGALREKEKGSFEPEARLPLKSREEPLTPLTIMLKMRYLELR
jgi:hypothetical protein